MAVALSVELISATVQVEQPLGDGTRTVATGFLVSDPTPGGAPRVVLITADHVFEHMPGDQATIGYRVQDADGSWRYAPRKLTIRKDGKALWAHHGARDVAAIVITAPPAFAKAAIPLNWLATDDSFDRYQLGPGDEMMILGFPQGLSSNSAGFPILRAGRVASYPLGPSSAFPTFLLDFQVFPGNSGGPVYIPNARRGTGELATPCVAGILTQEVQQGKESLGIGIVTQARFIRETVSLLDAPAGSQVPTALAGASAVSAGALAADAVAVGR
jgi:hypothetical protein